MGEDKYTLDYARMSLADLQEAVKATKNMADKRFQRFKGEVQEVIDRGRYDLDDHKTVKDVKKDVEVNIDSFEDIFTHLDGIYAANPYKVAKEMEELAKNFELISQRRETQRKKVKEANAAIEDEMSRKTVRIKMAAQVQEKKAEVTGKQRNSSNSHLVRIWIRSHLSTHL